MGLFEDKSLLLSKKQHTSSCPISCISGKCESMRKYVTPKSKNMYLAVIIRFMTLSVNLSIVSISMTISSLIS